MAPLIAPALSGEARPHFEGAIAREWGTEGLDPVMDLLGKPIVQRLREAGSFRMTRRGRLG